jgi:hypothetical protein
MARLTTAGTLGGSLTNSFRKADSTSFSYNRKPPAGQSREEVPEQVATFSRLHLPSVRAGTNLEIRTRKTVPARLNRSAAIMGKTTEPA